MTKSTKRIPRAQPEPYAYEGKPYVRPLLSQLLLTRAEWWATPSDLSPPHITATAHMLKVLNLKEAGDGAPFLDDWFQYQSWLCLLEANFQLTDGEG